MNVLPVGLRVYPVTTPKTKKQKDVDATKTKHPRCTRAPKSQAPLRRPTLMLVIDTETATQNTHDMTGFDSPTWNGANQSLLFGSARLYVHRANKWVWTDEYLFYADNLPSEGINVIQHYAESITLGLRGEHVLSVNHDVILHTYPLSVFMDVFYRVAYKDRGLIVGFNLPFDLSRLAVDVRPTKGRNRNGFGFVLWEWDSKTGRREPNPYRPRLRIKRLDPQKTLIDFAGTNDDHANKRRQYRGRFIDLSQLLFGLTNERHSLDGWCAVYKLAGKNVVESHGFITPDYISYNRQDVNATYKLAVHALDEFDKHPISTESGGLLAETQVLSPATVAKAYLDAMGIVPRKNDKFDANVMGHAMECYYGGRVETKIVKCEVPVVYADFTSMYPTVNALMGLWSWVIAEHIETDDCNEAQSLLDSITADDLFKPETWPKLNFIARIQPSGDILPVRALYGLRPPSGGESYGIGVNPYYSQRAQWYAAPDLVAAKLLSGKTPLILKATRFIPVSQQDALKPIKLGGIVDVNPADDDFFRKVIIERANVKAHRPPYDTLSDSEVDALQQFLKTLANAGSYGIYAQFNPVESDDATDVTVYTGDSALPLKLKHFETPGSRFFAPMATLITSAARLMLALLQHEVERIGGTYAMTDTDSMSIVSTEYGGDITIDGSDSNGGRVEQHVTALTWDVVNGIRSKFNAINPYGSNVKSLLKFEDENYKDGSQIQLFCHAVSAKRYALYTKDKDNLITIVKASESGLGQYMDPTGIGDKQWIVTAWSDRLNGRLSTWIDIPIVEQSRISTWNLYERFQLLNDGKDYASRIKPFNFVLSTSATSSDERINKRVTLIAPFTRNPAEWIGCDWIDYHDTGKRYKLYNGFLFVRDVGVNYAYSSGHGYNLRRYFTHAERDWLGCDGCVPTVKTRGVLERRSVTMGTIHYLGKELEEIKVEHVEFTADGIAGIQQTYTHSQNGGDVKHLIVRLTLSELSALLHVSPQVAKNIHSGRRALTDKQVNALREWCAKAIPTVSDGVDPIMCYVQSCKTLEDEILAKSNVVSKRSLQCMTGIKYETWSRYKQESHIPLPLSELQTIAKILV